MELANLAQTSGPIQANRTRTSLVKFMNWCAGEGLIEANPATFTNKNPEMSRDRVLTITELARVWHGVGEGDYADIVRLLMLLGQREREIGDLRWSEIDLDRAVITLPPQRTKNRRWHSVPLSSPAIEILRARPQNWRALVFGRGQGDRGFSGWSRAKARLDAAIQIEPWVVHDLRRTLDTVMNDQLGIAPHVVEAILNHVSSHKSGKAGVAGVYNHATYLKEKTVALRIWADHIMAAVEGREANVVPLQRAAE